MTNMELNREALEMEELEQVNGGILPVVHVASIIIGLVTIKNDQDREVHDDETFGEDRPVGRKGHIFVP